MAKVVYQSGSNKESETNMVTWTEKISYKNYEL